MAVNDKLTGRVREALTGVKEVEEKKMFRGIAFMVEGKLCITVGDDEIMCRIDPDQHEAALQNEGVRAVVMRGRPYRGYVYVNERVLQGKKQLAYWVQECLNYNPKAKSSKSKKSQ